MGSTRRRDSRPSRSLVSNRPSERVEGDANARTEPPPRQGGGKVEDVDGMIAKLKELGAL